MTAKPKETAAPRILVVDDDPGQRSLLQTFLERNGHQLLVAESGEAALQILAAAPVSLMISDVRMPGMTGLETLRRARQLHPKLPVLLVTAYADIREAVGAMRDGAVNYLSKPIDLDELLRSIEQITGPQTATVGDPPPLPPGILAVSPLMRAVFHDAALIAPSESRVLITGESGVGKEVLADAIHRWSPRAKGPLVKVNCAAIPETLLESELFGHEKGAFTGAHQARTGRFEEAGGGTIFLDEISEMSPQLQAKLLRVTQDGTFRRVGSGKELLTNARILAATNKNLEALIKEGRFREDLFYRLAVVELGVPPLRERREDILPLASHFIAQFGSDQTRFSPAVTEGLERYAWPGNVRELRNAMERAALLSRGGVVLSEHLPGRVRPSDTNASAAGPGDPQRLEEIERDAILAALKRLDYNRTETAKALAISRRALTYKIQRLRELGFPVDPPA
ncbi:MAG: sigma-54-dependent Fis family transcriptional regulator [Verrucomicrobia bacterium]|nr:sigma-54-dependent Fis family transcriptional regulator [Verrucomicrobiota bacterium]MBM3870245.1 sigma-54-dependent Fis family transcriptional regulator [Verrucomicrobiota bacterium]